MTVQGVSGEKIKARMRLMENPYAFIGLDEEIMESTPEEYTLEQKKAYFRKLENPHAFSAIFGDPDEDQNIYRTPTHIFPKIVAKGSPIAPGAEGVISRAELETMLDEVLGLYNPHVARSEWHRVVEYRAEFLDAACRTPAMAVQVAQRLQKFKFSLAPEENVEHHRAPAARIIQELRTLLS